MTEKKDENEKLSTFYFDENGDCCCIFIVFALIAFIGFFITLFNSNFDVLSITLFLIISLGLIGFFFIIARWDSGRFCKDCKKRVHPMFKEHNCKFTNSKFNEISFNKLLKGEMKNYAKSHKSIISNLVALNLFKNSNEIDIFKDNMDSLYSFEISNDYKYTMIAMGSILEFILKRYCELNGINPTPSNKDKFTNYLQTAINQNLFGQKNSWLIIQNNLRNFRNYVHIQKEMKEEKIDESWYNTMKPVFYRILENFH